MTSQLAAAAVRRWPVIAVVALGAAVVVYLFAVCTETGQKLENAALRGADQASSRDAAQASHASNHRSPTTPSESLRPERTTATRCGAGERAADRMAAGSVAANPRAIDPAARDRRSVVSPIADRAYGFVIV